MDRASFGVVMAGAMAALVGACGGSRQVTPGTPVTAATAGAGCGGAAELVPLGTPATSSTIALALVAGRRVAFVADEDAKAILTVDLETKQPIAETALGGRPSQLLVTKDGRVLVAMRDSSTLLAMTTSSPTAALRTRCEAKTPAEPIAIAATPDQATLVVTSGWGAAVTALDAKTLATRWTAPVAREPRGVVVSDDGRTAIVSHAVGSHATAVAMDGSRSSVEIRLRGYDPVALEGAVAAKATATKESPRKVAGHRTLTGELDLASLRSQQSCQGFAVTKAKMVPGRVFAPEVFVDPGDPEQRPDGYGDVQSDTESPNVAVIDEDAKSALLASVALPTRPGARQRRMMSPDPRITRPECLLPRAASVDEATGTLLVTCFGIDAVVAYDARSPAPMRAERRRWTVGSGPTGLAVDDEKRVAVVWSQFDRTLTTFPLGTMDLGDDRALPHTLVRTAMPALREKLPAEYALGRVLFHAAGDQRLSGDGRACASCHPDGRDDGITWATPEGPRRSIMLAGRIQRTPPYSWNGNEHTLPNHLANTFDRLSGNGLHGIELDALVTFISQMPAPPARTVDTAEKAKIDRGRQVFASEETRCASCHSGAELTDGQNHEVASKHKADRGAAFNTPSLRYVGGAGPFFHDGRYTSLRDLLDKTDGTMGKTKHLTVADREALEAYLRAL